MLSARIVFQRQIPITVRFGMEQISFDIPAVQGDAGPVFAFTCVDRLGAPIDLTGKDVSLFLRRSGAEAKSNASTACAITDATAGVAQYTPATDDFAKAGTYFGDLVITEGASRETAPSAIRIVVRGSNV